MTRSNGPRWPVDRLRAAGVAAIDTDVPKILAQALPAVSPSSPRQSSRHGEVPGRAETGVDRAEVLSTVTSELPFRLSQDLILAMHDLRRRTALIGVGFLAEMVGAPS